MKKIITVLLMLTCVLGLTACSDGEKTVKYDEIQVQYQTQIVAGSVATEQAPSAEELAYLDELNDDELDAIAEKMYETSGIKTEGIVLVNGVKSFEASRDIIGEVVEVKGYEVEAKEKELIATLSFTGTIHDGSIEVIYDKNGHITSITTNVEYSLAESMQKAAMNTAIGMGTVFIMLIVIMVIIYGFAVIPKIQASLEAKKNAKTTTEESVDNAIQGIVEREEEVATDDLELIAVIAAAIAASEGASSTDGFVVRSIKRIR